MHVNNLGGARMPVTTPANGASQTARTSFSTLVQGSVGVPSAGRAVSGSSIVASTISAHSGGIPGFGAPYRQAMAAGVPLPGVSGPPVQAPGTPATVNTPGAAAPGSEFNAELKAAFDQQKAMKELLQMSLISFVNTTFSLGQNRPKAEEW